MSINVARRPDDRNSGDLLTRQPRQVDAAGDLIPTALRAHLIVAEMGPARRAAFEFRCQTQGRKGALAWAVAQYEREAVAS